MSTVAGKARKKKRETHMAINIESIKKRLEELSFGGNNRDSKFKPGPGVHVVRAIPWGSDVDTPFKEKWFYYIGDEKGVLASCKYGKPDPVKEFIDKIRKDGKESSKAIVKALSPKLRAYIPVVVRGEEDTRKCRLWSLSPFLYKELMGIMTDADYGDITDPVDGTDLVVKVEKRPGMKFSLTTIKPKREKTPLTTDKQLLKDILSTIPDLDGQFNMKSYDELSDMLRAWVENGGPNQNSQQSTQSESDDADHHSDSAQSGPPTQQIESIDRAFDDLLAKRRNKK